MKDFRRCEEVRPYLKVMTYGGVEPQTINCINNRIKYSRFNWVVNWHPGDGAVDRQRSQACEDFLRDGSNVLVMVDHDIIFGLYDLDDIAERAWEAEGVVGGCYCKRAYNRGLACAFGDSTPHEIGADEMIRLGPTGYVAGGFVAIHYSVLHDIDLACDDVVETNALFRNFWLPKHIRVKNVDGEESWTYLSEDYAFSRRAQESGRPVYLWTRPVLGHIGRSVFSPNEGNQPGTVATKAGII